MVAISRGFAINRFYFSSVVSAARVHPVAVLSSDVRRNKALLCIAQYSDAAGSAGSKLAGKGVVSRLHPCLNSGRTSCGTLAAVTHPMRQVALARRAREAHYDSLDDAGRAVRGHQRRLSPHIVMS
jgi:hypothetical protein